MCGICGEVRFDGQSANVDRVSLMKNKLKHRGPDDEGLAHINFEGGGIALGHTRLAILDLSPAGRQPMNDSANRFWIVYNGEVYNYREIKGSLEKAGFVFRSKTDTEVVLAAYIKYGPKCLKLFNGMFAFAIWDCKKRSLFCARDRLGVKPFYYSYKKDVLYFASEIKALLPALGSRPAPDPMVVYDYLSLGLTHHTDRSFFSSICQLSAGCYMLTDISGISIRRYWHLAQNRLGNRGEPDIEALQFLIDDAVRLRLRSDVPVGVLLSGGLDSSSVTALSARNYRDPLQAFSLKFQGEEIDESHYAGITASHCGATLHLLEPEGMGLWEELDSLIKAQDAPTHAPEVYSNWCMMRAVSKFKIKVLLSGQGGDELFAGYNWYPKHFLVSLLRMGKISTLFNELANLPKNFPSNNTRSKLFLLASMFQALLPYAIKLRFKPELNCMGVVLRHEHRKKMQKRDRKNLKILDPVSLEEKMKNDLLMCNIPLYLNYEDANSMAFGIEERVPLLDYRLVEWSQELAVWWKIRGGMNKYILRKAMDKYLPEQITFRLDKRGLSAPDDQWFRNELCFSIRELFSEDCQIYENWVDRKTFCKQLDLYMKRKPNVLSRTLWRFINLEKWLRRYF